MRLTGVNIILEIILVFKKHEMARDSDPLSLRVIAKVSFLFIWVNKECTSK